VRRALAPALLVVAVGWAVIMWVQPFADDSVTDLIIYCAFSRVVLDGNLPYRDVFFEYPPLAVPFIALPGLISRQYDNFRLLFAAWTLLMAGGMVALCGAIAERTRGHAGRAMYAAAALPFLGGAMLRTHFDLAPIGLTLLALLLVLMEHRRAGLAVLGLAILTKGFPVVVAPVVLAWIAARHGGRAALRDGAVLVAVTASVMAVSLAVSADGTYEAFTYQLDRPVQVESAPAAILYGLDAVGLGDAVRDASHRSDNLVHPADDAIAAVFAAVLVGLLVLFTLLARGSPDDPRAMVLASLGAVAAFAACGRVVSPQYLIWTAPLGALAFAWGYRQLALLVALATVLTLAEFPGLYLDLVNRETLPILVVCLRDAALIAALALTVQALQVRGEENLLDTRRPAVAARLD
jgi:Glycosyltransferase family 87